jgi:transcriptional regulator with GAF, ATPase, and Fis domain
MMSVWHHFVGWANDPSRKAVVDALSEAGLATKPFEPGAGGACVLFIDHINPRHLDLLREISIDGLERVLAISPTGSALSSEDAWRLLEAGASDVFAWNHSANPAAEVAERFERWARIDSLVNSSQVQSILVGNSPAWVSILRRIVEVASFTDASVLLQGESGTGKELAARLIHALDSRPRKRDLVVVDCTTIIPELSGSELFGHERGAFTGAVATREGAFALADGSTLFLDEVGELPLALQAELLRAVQERTYKRVGSNTWQRSDFRLVCATNKDLLLAVEQGEFRRDLYHRIATWSCRLPPIRERPEDILPLACHFLQQLRADKQAPGLDEPVREFLVKHDYPGNVRDLKQLVTRIWCRHVGAGPITVGDIPEEDRATQQCGQTDWCDESFALAIRRALALGIGLKEIGRAAENTAVRIAVGDENGNLQRASRKLGVTNRALQIRRRAVRLLRNGSLGDGA